MRNGKALNFGTMFGNCSEQLEQPEALYKRSNLLKNREARSREGVISNASTVGVSIVRAIVRQTKKL